MNLPPFDAPLPDGWTEYTTYEQITYNHRGFVGPRGHAVSVDRRFSDGIIAAVLTTFGEMTGNQFGSVGDPTLPPMAPRSASLVFTPWGLGYNWNGPR